MTLKTTDNISVGAFLSNSLVSLLSEDSKKRKEFLSLFYDIDSSNVNEYLNNLLCLKEGYHFYYINIRIIDLLKINLPKKSNEDYARFIIHSLAHIDGPIRAARKTNAEYKSHFLTDVIVYFSDTTSLEKIDSSFYLKCLLNRLKYMKKYLFNKNKLKNIEDSIINNTKTLKFSNIKILIRTLIYIPYIILCYVTPFIKTRRSIYQYYDFVFEGIYKDCKYFIYYLEELLSLVFVLKAFEKFWQNSLKNSNLKNTKYFNEIGIYIDYFSEFVIQLVQNYGGLISLAKKFRRDKEEFSIFDKLLDELHLSTRFNKDNKDNYDIEEWKIILDCLENLYGDKMIKIIENRDKHEWLNFILNTNGVDSKYKNLFLCNSNLFENPTTQN